MRLLFSVLVGTVAIVAYLWYRSTHAVVAVRRPRRHDPAALVLRSLRALPLAFGIAAQFPRPGSVFPILAALPAAAGLLRHVAVDRRSRVYAATAPLLFLALALFLWVSAIGESVAVYGWLAWGSSALVIVAAIATTRPAFDEMTTALVDGIGFYLLFAVMLFVATGIESRVAQGRPETTTIFFGTRRVLWPLASSAQEPPIMAALYVIANAATKRLPSRAPAVLRGCFLASAVAIWMFADDRFAMFATIAVLLVGRRFVPRRVRAMGILCLVLLAMPVWWSAASSMLTGVARNATIVSRDSNGSELLSLNHRADVWKVSKSVLQQSTNRQLLTGYGLRGQRASGASAIYGTKYFGSYGDPLAASTHNSLLQLMFDQGVIGVGLAATAIVLAFTALYRRACRMPGDAASLGLLRLLGLLLASAAAEGVLSASFAQLPFWMLVVVLAIAVVETGRGREVELTTEASRPRARETVS